MFKWLFRKGFKTESSVGVILDWNSRLAMVSGYRAGSVLIVIKVPVRNEVQSWEVGSPQEAINEVRESLK
jgi:hypothetical protein